MMKEKQCFLNWNGKESALLEAQTPSHKKFCFKKEKSFDAEKTNNIYIQGDNLDALKLLKKQFQNKIKVVYIDPPYNTGKDFIYKDKFSHSEWCSMMYPRLIAARELMSVDGVIFISIDDNELCNLRCICDEIFGEENFVTQFIYEKTQHFGRQKLNVYSNAEYIICYAKNLYENKRKELLVERITEGLTDAPLYNASNKLTELVFPPKTVKFNIKDGIYQSSSTKKYKLNNPVEVKNSYNVNKFSLSFKSRWSQNKITEEIANGTTFLIKSRNFAIRAIYGKNKVAKCAPKQIIFTNKNNKHCAFNRFGEQVTTNETASKQLKELVDGVHFSYPKPVSLISYLLSLIYDYKQQTFDTNYTVLDFFSGSATTAQAVMELNALDNGNRNYILVQKPELINLETDAHKADYKTINDIAIERIIRVREKIKNKNPNTDTGIKVFSVNS